MTDETASLGAWQRCARARLVTDGAEPIDGDTAEAEIRWLIEHVLDLSTTQMILAEPRPLHGAQHTALETALARRLAGVPLAQIIGRAAFGPLELSITPDVLIPRADTEILVETALAARGADRPARVLELGTGSGAVALMLAHARPHWQIVATDRSRAALDCARRNASALAIETIEFVVADWFDGLAGHPFDLVVSNPPYIAADDPHLAALTHEPREALVAGPDGLADIDHIIAQAPAYLAPGGWLFLEHGHEQGSAVRKRLAEHGFENTATVSDLAGRDRVSGGVRGR